MKARLYLAGLVVATLAQSGCQKPYEAPPVPGKLAPVAGRLVVELQSISDLKPVAATLTSRDMAEARARISGVLVSLAVKEGDLVRKGQLVARVADDRIALQTRALDAQIAAAAAEATRAQTELGRARALVARGVYPQTRLDQAEAEAKAATAAVAAARAQRAASAELAAQGSVLAPAAGRVLLAPIPVGSMVSAGQSIARITAGPMVVRIELPEAQARAIKPGDVVTVEPQDVPGSYRGVVSQVYPAVSGGQVVADVSAPDLSPGLIGQRIRAAVKVAERRAIVIPRDYVATRFGIDYAALVRKDGAVSETPVQVTAGPSPETFEVLSGLRPGDVLTPFGKFR